MKKLTKKSGTDPNPNCHECKGTGQIKLFTSIQECDCIHEDYGDPDETEEFKYPFMDGDYGFKVILD